ncbi:MAG: hypothetical protein MK211_06675 [Flavobacteriales bacterium]|jgi:hypothetical protein|uniref:hypothetical protein n=1 Tax=Candidatus Ulvibacter alkanivorans TaxID=2267620 RepID=UPI000DF11B11|nr:hypothetical protein [Candidatus Ulvibacter alkanivorans]MCH2489818.1 hypothetical protein [Flavobacteriales bacterium]
MKTKFTLFALLIALCIGCSPEQETLEATDANFIIEIGGDTTSDPNSTIYQTDLMAGQHTLAGIVNISEDNGSTTVSYITEGDWEIEEIHLFVGPLEDLPTNGGGNPKIGRFPYKATYPAGTTDAPITVPGIAPGDCVYVAAHAVVVNTVTGDEETAWGAGESIGGNSWAMMFEVCN